MSPPDNPEWADYGESLASETNLTETQATLVAYEQVTGNRPTDLTDELELTASAIRSHMSNANRVLQKGEATARAADGVARQSIEQRRYNDPVDDASCTVRLNRLLEPDTKRGFEVVLTRHHQRSETHTDQTRRAWQVDTTDLVRTFYLSPPNSFTLTDFLQTYQLIEEFVHESSSTLDPLDQLCALFPIESYDDETLLSAVSGDAALTQLILPLLSDGKYTGGSTHGTGIPPIHLGTLPSTPVARHLDALAWTPDDRFAANGSHGRSGVGNVLITGLVGSGKTVTGQTLLARVSAHAGRSEATAPLVVYYSPFDEPWPLAERTLALDDLLTDTGWDEGAPDDVVLDAVPPLPIDDDRVVQITPVAAGDRIDNHLQLLAVLKSVQRARATGAIGSDRPLILHLDECHTLGNASTAQRDMVYEVLEDPNIGVLMLTQRGDQSHVYETFEDAADLFETIIAQRGETEFHRLMGVDESSLQFIESCSTGHQDGARGTQAFVYDPATPEEGYPIDFTLSPTELTLIE